MLAWRSTWTWALALASSLGALAAALAGASPQPDGLYAQLHSAKGVILVRLEPDRAPLATTSFVGLAEGTIANDAFDPGVPYYDGTVFHRVVPGHVIQAGAPVSERAQGPGYVFANEIHGGLSHDHAGAFGVANAGPHTNGAQFYVTLGDRSYLDGDYIVFGEVVEGMDVVHAIVQGDVIEQVRIVRSGAAAEAFRADTASFQRLAAAAAERAARDDAARLAAFRDWVAERWPAAEGPEDGVRELVRQPPAAGAAGSAVRFRYYGVAVRYMGHLLGHDGPDLVENGFGSGPDGVPGPFDPPASFGPDAEGSVAAPGLAQALSQMAPGERRVVIVPPDLAYGSRGHYAPERPGERRFVIPPNALLVYDVEAFAGR